MWFHKRGLQREKEVTSEGWEGGSFPPLSQCRLQETHARRVKYEQAPHRWGCVPAFITLPKQHPRRKLCTGEIR